MKSTCTAGFWEQYSALHAEDRKRADKAFQLWLSNASHPSLRFKYISTQGLWSARITDGLRALAVKDDDTYIWFFIGSHEDYERLID